MVLKRVLDELLGSGADSLLVGGLYGSDRGVVLVNIATGKSGVVGASVVVSAANCVESVNDIGTVGAGATTVATLSCADVAPNSVEWPVRHVAGIALLKWSLVEWPGIRGASVTPVRRICVSWGEFSGGAVVPWATL